MNKSKLLIILVCLFLVQTSVASSQDVGTSSINFVKKVSPTDTSIKETFLKEFNILTFALGLYYMDAKARLPKEAIEERLTRDMDIWKNEFGVSFDLENMDFKRKGLTRYYPFNVRGNDLIIRIFHTSEKHYLLKCDVLEEGVFEDSSIGFQIIPGVNALLGESPANKIKPLEVTPTAKFL